MFKLNVRRLAGFVSQCAKYYTCNRCGIIDKNKEVTIIRMNNTWFPKREIVGKDISIVADERIETINFPNVKTLFFEGNFEHLLNSLTKFAACENIYIKSDNIMFYDQKFIDHMLHQLRTYGRVKTYFYPMYYNDFLQAKFMRKLHDLPVKDALQIFSSVRPFADNHNSFFVYK